MPKRLLCLLFLLLAFALTSPAQNRRPAQKKPTTQQAKKKPAATQPKKRQQATPQKPTKAQMQQQQAEQQRRRREEERKRRQVEEEVRKRMDNVLMLSNEIGQQQLVIDSIQKGIALLNTDIARLDSQLVKLQAQLDEHRNRYKQTMRYMHRNRSVQNRLMFVFGAENFRQMYRRMRFMNEYADYQQAQGEAVKQKQEEVTAKQRELSEQQRKQKNLLAQGQRARQKLEQQQTEQQAQVSNLQKQKKTLDAVIAQRRKQEAELERQIAQRIAEEMARAKAQAEAEERRQAEARRKAEAARQASGARQGGKAPATGGKKKPAPPAPPTPGRKGGTAPAAPPSKGLKMPKADRELAANFAENRGKLPMPLVGAYRVVKKFGANAVEGMAGVILQSTGIELRGMPGTQVRSIFNGVVSNIYQPIDNGPFVVMVRHGNYISVYSDLRSVSVKPGQNVTTRQTIGTCGSEGRLVFQLRDNRTALNPMRWLNK